MEIKIEKNISIPTGKFKYPLDKLEVGDSFLIPKSEKNTLNYHINKLKASKKFITRSVKGGTRVWRVL